MAFTDTQKVATRRYLCFSLGHYQYNTQFESMFDKIGSVPEEQAAVESILAELVAIDAAVAAAGLAPPSGALKKVDEVEFYAPKDSLITIVDAVRRGQMLCQRLADTFGVVKAGDYFGARRSMNVDLALG